MEEERGMGQNEMHQTMKRVPYRGTTWMAKKSMHVRSQTLRYQQPSKSGEELVDSVSVLTCFQMSGMRAGMMVEDAVSSIQVAVDYSAWCASSDVGKPLLRIVVGAYEGCLIVACG